VKDSKCLRTEYYFQDLWRAWGKPRDLYHRAAIPAFTARPASQWVLTSPFCATCALNVAPRPLRSCKYYKSSKSSKYWYAPQNAINIIKRVRLFAVLGSPRAQIVILHQSKRI
jgi:hypothetical protein